VDATRPRWTRHVLCFALVALLTGSDLASKSAVMSFLERNMARYNPQLDHSAAPVLARDAHGHERYPVLGSGVAFMHNLNYGAAFGRLAGVPWLLVVGRCVAAVTLIVLILRAEHGARVYLAALVLILAGALGNLYDNLFYAPPEPDPAQPFGPVRDFIDVYFEAWDQHFETFNVADACIVVGVALLLVSWLLGRRARAPEVAPEPGS
jgi:signal peptidase II